MQGLGDRLRARGRQLGWSDTEIARRANVGSTTYANYLADRHEPDLPTLVRICAVLGASPAELLGYVPAGSTDAIRSKERVGFAMEGMDDATLALLALVADRFVATSARPVDEGRSARPAARRRKAPASGE